MATYNKIADEAAAYERKGNLRLAALMWEKASEVTKNKFNCQYAENRAAFCRKYQKD